MSDAPSGDTASGERARTRVLVLFGGRSSEHQISCLSARSVLWAIDRQRYDVVSVGITRGGRWTLVDGVAQTREGTLPSVPDSGDTVTLVRGRGGPRLVSFAAAAADATALTATDHGAVDVCFPVLHGPYGEDGTIQGLLASLGVPYVGADVASSAIAIDKRQMKSVFAARGLPQVAHQAVFRPAWEADRDAVLAGLEAALTYPVFTKPARQGSSIGISRATGRDQLIAGVEDAFGYDRVAIVEQAVVGAREIECGVIGNAVPEISRPGETVHAGPSFYDFDAKYLAPVELRCPAELPDEVQRRCVDYARAAYLAIGARGMARVDFFWLEATDELLVNEINTIPGLTPTSMFPPVWAAEGLEFRALIDRLLDLAQEAAAAEARYAP